LSELYYFKDSEGAPVIVSDTDPLPIGDVSVGDKTDTAVTDPTLSASEIALLKGLVKILSDVWDDTNNRLGIKTIGVKDTDGTYGEVASFTLDGDGRPVQRIVDAAPFAYDETGDTTKVTLQQVEGAIDSAVPTRAAFVGGKYSSADPSYHDGDLTPVRTNAKGEVLTQQTGSIASAAIIAPVTINAGATSADSSVLDYHAKYPKQLLLTIVGTFATTSATTGLRLQLFYSPDNSSWDTDAFATIEPTFTASSGVAQTKQKTRPVTVGAGYYKANVVNLDAGVAATTVKVTATEVV